MDVLDVVNKNNNELTFKASLYTTFLCILFGANTVAIKISLAGLGIFTNVGIRFALAAAALIIWAKITGQMLGFNRSQGYKLLILSLIFTIQLSSFYYGLSITTASHGILIANLLPFVVLVLAHFFIPGDKITSKKVIGIAWGFTGVIFLFFDSNSSMVSQKMHLGDVIIGFAVILWGCSAVYTKIIMSQISVLQITLYPMLFGSIIFFIAGFLFDNEMFVVFNYAIINSIIYQSFVTASYGFIAWNRLLHRFGATNIHSFVFVMPVSGVFLSVVMLGETLTFNIIISIVFIITGMFIVNRHDVARNIQKSI